MSFAHEDSSGSRSRYDAVSVLARGGMGTVEIVAVKKGDFRRLFARKRLRPELVADERAMQMLVEEGRIAGLLRHPNVVHVLDVGVDGDGPYLIMELVRGLPASDLLRHARTTQRPLELQLVMRLVEQAARGLHAVREDASALSSSLTASDRMRLDQHLTAIRELEVRLAASVTACTLPADPSSRVTDAMIDSVPEGERHLTLLNDLLSELLAMALACDLTRVASYMYSGPAAFTRYWEIGALSRDVYGQPEAVHALSHDGRVNEGEFLTCQREAMRHFGRTLDALARIPEGEGTLLDHMVVLGTSCTGSAPSHQHDEYPLIVAGRGGGALVAGGLHHRFASPENASRIPLTLARAMDVPMASFGAGAGQATSPVSELLTGAP